jgi:hypothetical protein
MSFSRIDAIEELRLRRWAREHYVVASQRPAHWHPIILDEMLAKDDELRIAARQRKPVNRPFFMLEAGHVELVTSYPEDRSAVPG